MSGNTFLNSFESTKQTNLNPILHVDALRNFRLLKNLGSRVHSVKPYYESDSSGFQVMYGEGDHCLSDKSRRYESMVNYQCDPNENDEANLYDFPQLVAGEKYYGVHQCKFDFVWKSRFACSPCTMEQVVFTNSFCGADGMLSVHAERKEGEQCVIDFIPEAVL